MAMMRDASCCALVPVGLWVALDAARLHASMFDLNTPTVHLMLGPPAAVTPAASPRVEQPAKTAGAGTCLPTESGEAAESSDSG